MDTITYKMKCVLIIFTVLVQEGLSGDFEAHLGENNLLLQRLKRQSQVTKPVLKVTDYHVKCMVVSRYVLTTVQSTVWNQLPVTKEAAFEVDLPSSAFISNFTITSNGKVYVAQVKERTAARKIYDAAKKQGQTAGLIATKEREVEKFRVAVNVPSGTSMSFVLSYEELLTRRLGRYELSLGLRPSQPVDNLTLDVSIEERTGIGFIKVLPLRTHRLLSNAGKGEADAPASTQVEQSAFCAHVLYSPSLQQQSSMSSKGLYADFIIHYDVELRDLMGEVQVNDGYFVHFFAPRGLPVVPKDVIFVIDISGSMIGTKIKQTKQAMNTILGDLREGDHFNIITFSDKVYTWRKGQTVRATRQNIRDAKDFIQMIIAEGWTNINTALLSAGQLVNPPPPSSSSQSSSRARRVPLVFFLTDGEATVGVTSGGTILTNAKKALGSASLFCIAFGDDADFPLLKRLALDNRGVARMVYEDSDAVLQLKGFYDEVATPLLSDIQLSYLDEQAFDITSSLFPNYFQGSELVVTGRVKPDIKGLKVSLTAIDSTQLVKAENDLSIAKGSETENVVGCSGRTDGISSFVHRLWAYFTIKELLLARQNSTDLMAQRLLAEKATNLSLKYNFVTPVTSLVVIKPDADEVAQSSTAVSSTSTQPTPSSSTTATTTTTITRTLVSKIAYIAAKKPSLPSKPNKRKPDPSPPEPPPGQPINSKPTKKNSTSSTLAKTVAPPSTKRSTTTLSPSAFKTAPAPMPGKISFTNSSKPAGRISIPVLSTLKTAPPAAPGKMSTPQPSSIKTTPPVITKNTTSVTTTTPIPQSSVRTEPAPLPGKPLTSQPSTMRSALPPALPALETENSTAPAADMNPPELTTVVQAMVNPILSPTAAPALVLQDNNTDSDLDPGVHIASLVSATFAPMPGVTSRSELREAAERLDVSTSIQFEKKDYDATPDYDYDLDYDTWDNPQETQSYVLQGGNCPFDDCGVLFEPLPTSSSAEEITSSVDGDPHFVLQLPKLHQKLCFTVDGRANDVLRLLEDTEKGIIVDGHLTGAPSKQGVEERTRTYFDQLTISSSVGVPGAITITLSLDGVVVEGEGRDILPINQQATVSRQGVTVVVDNHRSCWIELAEGVDFLVLFHHYKQPNYWQMAHLGFYITNGHGLSSSTQGLLGQFQHADMDVTELRGDTQASIQRSNREAGSTRGTLRWGSMHMPVILQGKTLKDPEVAKRHMGECWVVPKTEVERLLGHPYQSYVVDHL